MHNNNRSASNGEIEKMDDEVAKSIDMPKIVCEEIRRNLEKVHSRRPSDCTIYRIPEFVFKENPAAYVPHKVSIGPFHHDQQHLQPMEARKMEYLQNFLNTYPVKLEDYVNAITDLVEKAKQCYAEVKPHGKNLVMMMVVDGCFILELLLREPNNKSDAKWDFLVLTDLILLENQLPFMVLEALYKLFNLGSGTLYSLVCEYFVPQILRLLLGDVKMNSTGGIDLTEPKHLLDVVRLSLKPPKQMATDDQKNEETSVGKATKPIRCATELKKAGVKFKKNKNPTSLLDIKFEYSKGVLTIPGITIDHSTQSILRNLVAYEQYTDDYNYITEYAAFLDGLIDSRNDVEVLQKNGIIETILGDPSEIAELFNSLLKDSVVTLDYTIDIRHQVEQYYNVPWHKWKASLMLNYFNTPWSLISVIAAIILLVLTFTQTYYSAKPYVRY